MFNKLIGTQQNLLDFLKEENLEIQDLPAIEQCANCSIWYYSKELINDLDGNPICHICERFYGL